MPPLTIVDLTDSRAALVPVRRRGTLVALPFHSEGSRAR